MSEYEPPVFKKAAFNCPFCKAYSHQFWSECYTLWRGDYSTVGNLWLSYCSHCTRFAVWYNKQMLFPMDTNAPLPHEDLPDEIRQDYEEARNIVNFSPRGASALLRLAVQKLAKYLGGKGENLNEDIELLVKNGLPEKIQQALDIIRVIGNNAVHPGQIDIRDNLEIANQLFEMVNFIVERMITQPKKIEEIYNKLPETQKQSIKKRDKK